jgi:hypothetical protein
MKKVDLLAFVPWTCLWMMIVFTSNLTNECNTRDRIHFNIFFKFLIGRVRNYLFIDFANLFNTVYLQ